MKNRIWMGFILTILCTLMMGVTVLAANTTLKNKMWVSGAGGSYVDTDKDGVVDDFKSNGESFYKIKIQKQGYIMVDMKTSKLPKEDEYYKTYMGYEDDDGDWECTTYISFLNSSKKKLDEHHYSRTNGKKGLTFSAAVKKGTYYIKVSGERNYKVRYRFTAVGKLSKKGTEIKSAPILKKGVTAKNLLFPNQWMHMYKIKLSKKTKINIHVLSKIKGDDISGYLAVQLLTKKGKKYRFINEKGKPYSDDNVQWWAIEGKDRITATLPKGTYYIKVSAMWGSGYYTVKWK